jgi:hypothetical protein
MLNKLILILNIYLLTSSFTSVNGQSTDVKDKEIVFYYIYNQQFNLAEKALQNYNKSLDPFIKDWLKCELLWWKTVSNDEEKTFNNFKRFLNQKINLSKDNLSIMLYNNYMMRLMAFKKNTFKTIKYYYKVNVLNKRIDTHNLTPFQKDIYLIFNSVFNITKNNLIFAGNDKDISYFSNLNNYETSNNLILKTLSKYFLMKIYLEIKKDKKTAKKYLKTIINYYPNNKLLKKLCHSL